MSTEPVCHVLVPMIMEKAGEPLALDETVTAEQFEEMTKELMERTHHPIDVVLTDSGIRQSGSESMGSRLRGGKC